VSKKNKKENKYFMVVLVGRHPFYGNYSMGVMGVMVIQMCPSHVWVVSTNNK
jgi:hypothetical protein